jgi:hypothetical protein
LFQSPSFVLFHREMMLLLELTTTMVAWFIASYHEIPGDQYRHRIVVGSERLYVQDVNGEIRVNLELPDEHAFDSAADHVMETSAVQSAPRYIVDGIEVTVLVEYHL